MRGGGGGWAGGREGDRGRRGPRQTRARWPLARLALAAPATFCPHPACLTTNTPLRCCFPFLSFPSFPFALLCFAFGLLLALRPTQARQGFVCGRARWFRGSVLFVGPLWSVWSLLPFLLPPFHLLSCHAGSVCALSIHHDTSSRRPHSALLCPALLPRKKKDCRCSRSSSVSYTFRLHECLQHGNYFISS